jgi:hypothetical protein
MSDNQYRVPKYVTISEGAYRGCKGYILGTNKNKTKVRFYLDGKQVTQFIKNEFVKQIKG